MNRFIYDMEIVQAADMLLHPTYNDVVRGLFADINLIIKIIM